ncbi:hypothetical protein ACYJW8_06940 [Frateuria aurantia]
MSGQDKPPLEKEARRLYVRASRELPRDIEDRLNRARREALAKAGPRNRLDALQRKLWWPAGALAVSCAMLLLWQPGSRTGAPSAPSAVEAGHAALHNGLDTDGDLPPDAGQGDTGMYQDLAFYNWLATGQAPASAH